jgi:hypothetical protein
METPVKLSLDSYITSTAPMLVPRFQRPYAWTQTEIEDFLEDLAGTLAKRNELSSKNRDVDLHFFGGILSTQWSQPETNPTYFNEVVDGQQRLATVFLALVALRKSFLRIADELGASADKNERLARGLADSIDRYLTYEHTDLQTGESERRQSLRLSDIDRDFFSQMVAGSEPKAANGAPPSHKRLRRAFRALDGHFSDAVFSSDSLSAEERLTELKEVMLALTKNFYVIKLFTQADRQEAFKLFMVLNDRGVSLSDAELLRTHSLEFLQDKRFQEHQDDVARLWDQMFESSDVAGFLTALFASRTGVRAPRRNLYRAYLEHVFPESDVCKDRESAQRFRDLIRQIQSEHVTYSLISAGEWPYRASRASFWQQRRLERLVVVLQRTGDIPLLLAAKAAYPNDDSVFAQLVQLLEHFGLRWHAGKMHSGTLSEAYFEHATQLRADPEAFSVENFRSELSAFVVSHVPAHALEAGLRTRLQYGSAQTNRVIKHVLTTIEDYRKSLESDPTASSPHLKPDTESAYDLSQIQLEHIYPQEPQPEHRNQSLDAVVHDLGNLTFLSADDNIQASNKPFHLKTTDYARATSEMTRAISANSTWTAEDVAARTNSLIHEVKRIYALPESETPLPKHVPASFWLITQKAENNPYEDVAGIKYVYRTSLPNGKRIREGDFVAILQISKDRRSVARKVVAVARIGNFVDENGLRHANYSHFLTLSPPRNVLLDDDPRLNRQHSMNRISAEIFSGYLPEGCGIDDIQQLPNR